MPSDAPIRKIQPEDVPFSEDMTEGELDWLVEHQVFDRLDSEFRKSQRFRKILKNHARIVACDQGDIIVREGDWGNSAFFILAGDVAVEVEAPGEFLSGEHLGRGTSQPKTFLQALAQLWRNHRQPEYRDQSTYIRGEQKSTATRDDGLQIYFQDVPQILNNFNVLRLHEGDFFGELAALGRTARTATVFAVEEGTKLLEMRWQGLRDTRRKDAGFEAQINARFREVGLAAFLKAAPQLRHLRDDEEAIQELTLHAKLKSYGEYDRSGTFKQIADEGVASNLANEEIIAEEGHYANGVILIRSGVARVSRRHYHGHKTLTYLTPGGMFGFEELAEGWRTGDAVPFSYSLRAIGYLTAVLIPSALVEKYLLQHAGTQPRHNQPNQVRRTSASLGEVGFVDPNTVEFLVQERFVNGTATMLINLDRCTRCDDCVRACASTHDNNPRFLRQGPVHGNMMVARACMHCQDPTCMIECPTGAISRQLHGGEVTINDNSCIGCGACSRNCPYDAIRMVEIRDSSGMFIRADKDRKPIPKATKCDLCVDQRGGPACQRACPHDALARIDMGDVESVATWLHR